MEAIHTDFKYELNKVKHQTRRGRLGGRRTVRGTPRREPHIPYQIPKIPYQIWNSMSY